MTHTYAPDWTAPLPRTYGTGALIPSDPGDYTVYAWREADRRWEALLTTGSRQRSTEFAVDIAQALTAKGVPWCARIEGGE